MLEKVVCIQLQNHLGSCDLYEPLQSAYRSNHSTETALLRVQNDILCSMSEGKTVLLVLLDLSAAFDTVDFSLLLEMLKLHGITGTVLKWFSSYLKDRTQRVQVFNSLSNSQTLTSGVPQGSILGPVLFTIYTSALGRMLRELRKQYHLYADDSQLYIAFKASDPTETKSAIADIEHCIDSVKNWMSSFNLKMNDTKTEVLVLTRSRKFPKPVSNIRVGETVIEVTSSARNIGVVMDSSLSLEEHIGQICKRCYLQLRKLSRLRRYLNTKSVETLVHSMISSQLDYCNSLFIGLPSYLIYRLQKIQNTAARIVSGVRKRDHISPVLEALHWLPVDSRIQFKILVIVFKCIHGLAPAYLRELVTGYQPPRLLRSGDQCLVDVPFTRSALASDRAFSVVGPRLWNELPPGVKQASTVDIFKKRLKTHFFNKSYH